MKVVPLLEVWRGDVVETLHHGAFAVSDLEGHTLTSMGDPELVTFMRSAAKPFQALALIESGAVDALDLTAPQLAILCASHSGTDEHVRVVESIQKKLSLSEDELSCGTHAPFDRATAERILCEGELLTPNRHNCSGKHTGMLAFADQVGAPRDGYIEPSHPVQQKILETLSEMLGLDHRQIGLGTDGCSVPTFAVPLRAAATGYARLVSAEYGSTVRTQACWRVVEAMTSEPFMVAGPARFDTVLMQVTRGRILAKGGAEGFQGLGIRPGTITQGSPALGVALKIADGDLGGRARDLVALSILEALGALMPEERDELRERFRTEVINARGQVVGKLHVDLSRMHKSQEAV